MRSRILVALLQRKIASDLAEDLIRKDINVGKLKQMSRNELVSLGLTNESIDILVKGERPPIPEKTVRKILFESKYTCCICRDGSKPTIIHHIIPWEKSRSHSESNLVVLCLEHHGEAHSKHELSINLTPERIRDAKEKWIAFVKETDVKTILNIHKTEGAFYDYFNLHRIFELADNLNIDLQKNKFYSVALGYGFINEIGLINPIKSWSEKNIEEKDYWLDFFEGTYLYHYIKHIFTSILEKQQFVILNRVWNRSEILSIIKPGTFLLVQGVFYFKSLTNKMVGTQQLKLGYRRAKGIKIEFEIDVFYRNSDSSTGHLSGRNVKSVYCLVRSHKLEENFLVLTCTALAIGTGFNRLDTHLIPYPAIDFYNEEELDFSFEEDDLEDETII